MEQWRAHVCVRMNIRIPRKAAKLSVLADNSFLRRVLFHGIRCLVTHKTRVSAQDKVGDSRQSVSKRISKWDWRVIENEKPECFS
jgi:hypothetical protein